jgi:hypothetical protein
MVILQKWNTFVFVEWYFSEIKSDFTSEKFSRIRDVLIIKIRHKTRSVRLFHLKNIDWQNLNDALIFFLHHGTSSSPLPSCSRLHLHYVGHFSSLSTIFSDPNFHPLSTITTHPQHYTGPCGGVTLAYRPTLNTPYGTNPCHYIKSKIFPFRNRGLFVDREFRNS